VPDDESGQISETESPLPSPPIRKSDEISEPSPTSSPAVQDRWARIRKNAAERAERKRVAAPKISEDSSAPDTRESIDDGDTSGEETIESRVARIKARVAELTGTAMEPGSGERS